MKSTLDILSDDFPHGSPDGHRLGCRTNHCPAPIACHVVQRRYAGDLVFRRRVDSGMSVADIAAAEIAEAVERREAERAANRRIREAVRREGKAAKKMKRSRYGVPQVRKSRAKPGAKSRRLWTAAEEQQIRDLNAERLNDKQIAERLGRNAEVVRDKRRKLGLAPIGRVYTRKRPVPKREATVRPLPLHGTRAMYNRGCKLAQHDTCPATTGMTCYEANRRNSRISVRKHREAKKEQAA